MQTISKTQVLALFLGATTATQLPQSNTLTAKDLLNGPASEERVTEGTIKILPASTGADCNGGCDDEGQQCGSFQTAGAEGVEVKHLCVAKSLCGAVGKINDTPFALQCWKAVADGDTPVEPAHVDPTDYLAQVEEIITKVTVNFNDARNLLVSPQYNYQDGWYILDNEEGKWEETDKMPDNRCFIDQQCEANECCALYPDHNGRRCMAKENHNKVHNFGPITFTPTCPSFVSEEPIEPENAQDDIAAGALSEASEELTRWYDNILADRKIEAGYDGLTDDEKKAFDEIHSAAEDERNELWDTFKAAINYEDEEKCDDQCKAIFEAELLKWEQKVYEACKENDKAINCRKAKELQIDMEESRAKSNYYTQDKEVRMDFDEGFKNELNKIESQLVALAINDSVNGLQCNAERPCQQNLCCGKSVPLGDTGRLPHESICIDTKGGSVFHWEDNLGIKFAHTCFEGAIKIGASIATAAALISIM